MFAAFVDSLAQLEGGGGLLALHDGDGSSLWAASPTWSSSALVEKAHARAASNLRELGSTHEMVCQLAPLRPMHPRRCAQSEWSRHTGVAVRHARVSPRAPLRPRCEGKARVSAKAGVTDHSRAAGAF